MSIIKEVQALWGGYAPQCLHRVFILSSDPFALVAGLIEASKSNLLCVQRRKAKTLQLGAFEDIQSDFINHGYVLLNQCFYMENSDLDAM